MDGVVGDVVRQEKKSDDLSWFTHGYEEIQLYAIVKIFEYNFRLWYTNHSTHARAHLKHDFDSLHLDNGNIYLFILLSFVSIIFGRMAW